MKSIRTPGSGAAWLAIWSLCLPTSARAVQPVAQAKPVVAPREILDVALAPGGVLAGRVVDAQGRAQVKTSVRIARPGGESVWSVTDQQGWFSARELRGGVYQISTDTASRVCRLWAHRTAPPAAKPGLLLVASPDAVVGQWEPGTLGHFLQEARITLTNPLVVGGIVAAAVAIPVAIHNADDDVPSGS